MRTSEQGLLLIRKFEGLKLESYKCSAGVWTIGYGHTSNVKKSDKITKDEAENLLQNDLIYFESAICDFVKVPLNQNQFDALVSFVFNIGVGAFSTSTMLKFINANHFPLAAGQFDRWVYAKGKKLEGLVKRRKEEKELFLGNKF